MRVISIVIRFFLRQAIPKLETINIQQQALLKAFFLQETAAQEAIGTTTTTSSSSRCIPKEANGDSITSTTATKAWKKEERE